MASTIKVEPLTEENYDEWKIHMTAILRKNDLWGYVNGEIPRPVEANKLAEWIVNDGKAQSDLVLHLRGKELKLCARLGSAKAIWDKLQETFESSGATRRSALMKKCVTMKMHEGDDLRKHVTEFCDTAAKLNDIGITVPDEMLVILLMHSLPDSFAMFKESIESQEKLPKLDALKVRLYERLQGQQLDGENSQGALYSRRSNASNQGPSHQNSNKFRRPDQSQAPKRKIKCHRCEKEGHIARECRAKHPAKSKPSSLQPECNEASSSRNRSQKQNTMLGTSEEAMYAMPSGEWCLDSGSTSHMCNQKDSFEKFTHINSELTLANHESTRITGTGNVRLVVDANGDREINFERVLYVSDLRTNLLSVSKATDHGFDVTFRRNYAIVTKNKEVVLRADRRGDLYFVRKAQNCAKNTTSSKKDIDIWHEKLGHLNERDIKLMAKNNAVHGLKINNNEKLSECEICIREKQTRLPFNKTEEKRTRNLLEVVHSDVCGPMRQASFSGMRYFVTFVDDKSRWCQIYFVKSKTEVLNVFKQYKSDVENYTGHKIKALQSDNGREYCNREFDLFLQEQGIKRRLTTPHTPQQNGIAERKNRTLVEMARCMMRQAGSPPSFWAEAIFNANHTRNRCPTSALKGGIPYTMWTGKTPTLGYFQIFGTKVFVLNKEQNKGKFDSRSKAGIFLGYSKTSKAYRIYMPETRKTIESRDVKFLSYSGFQGEYTEIFDGEGRDEITCIELTGDVSKSAPKGVNTNDIPIHRNHRERRATVPWEHLVQPAKRGRGRPKLVRTGQVGRPRKQYHSATDERSPYVSENESSVEGEDYLSGDEGGDDDTFENVNLTITAGPTTWEQASKMDDANGWKRALEDEFLAQIKNTTWEIVDRPKNRKIIGNRLVFCTKTDGETEKKRVRLVAKGCSQKPGEDFYETYSPVARSTSIRLLAALSAELGLDIHQMDVVTAYLNGDLEESVYMSIPEQLREVVEKIVKNEPVGSNGQTVNENKVKETAKRWLSDIKKNSDCVCRLKKALYGLRQSGLQWYKKLVSELRAMGFNPLPQDSCLFICAKNEKCMLIAVYVDDLLIASDDDKWLHEIKESLSKSFEIKDLGKVNRCLGIEFSRDDNNCVYLKQRFYTEDILKRFNMENCKPVATPSEVNLKLTKPRCADEREMKVYPYQSLIGALMYLAVTTRPDIAFAVNYSSQFNKNYNATHWNAAKRVLRYLKGTLDYGLKYEKTDLSLFGVADADWGGNVVDYKSYSGFAFILAGAPISWEARKQRVVAQSTTESEYIALSEATKEAIYLRETLNGLNVKTECVKIFSDNQSAIELVKNNVFHPRTKHIALKYHKVRDEYQKGKIDIQYLSSEQMPADMLTKGLSGPKHNECIINIGMTTQ